MAKVLIVGAGFYRHIYDLQLKGAIEALEAGGHKHELVEVPGALEIPAAISMAADSGAYDAYVALGCVIRGETFHFEIVSTADRWAELFGEDKPQPWSADMMSVTLTPAATNTDGFFFCVMEKAS